MSKILAFLCTAMIFHEGAKLHLMYINLNASHLINFKKTYVDVHRIIS